MKAELEHDLISKYPDLFRNRLKSPQESLMCFGCECGDGWHGILDNLFGYLENIRRNRSRRVALKPELATPENGGFLEVRCPKIILDQVKEKYGTLRVYWHFDTDKEGGGRSMAEDPEAFDRCIEQYGDAVENAVEFAEHLSSKTCEVTGQPGKLYTDGWCVTLCDDEAAKRFGMEEPMMEGGGK